MLRPVGHQIEPAAHAVYPTIVQVYVPPHWPFVQRQDSGLWIR
jgi:hypothetical protein